MLLDEQWLLTGASEEAQDEVMESAHSKSGFEEEEEEKEGS